MRPRATLRGDQSLFHFRFRSSGAVKGIKSQSSLPHWNRTTHIHIYIYIFLPFWEAKLGAWQIFKFTVRAIEKKKKTRPPYDSIKLSIRATWCLGGLDSYLAYIYREWERERGKKNQRLHVGQGEKEKKGV